jgi:hypothetical protein
VVIVRNIGMVGSNDPCFSVERSNVDVSSKEVVKDSVSGPKGTTLTDDKGEYFSPTSCLMCQPFFLIGVISLTDLFLFGCSYGRKQGYCQ